jgi:hypothetical protein
MRSVPLRVDSQHLLCPVHNLVVFLLGWHLAFSFCGNLAFMAARKLVIVMFQASDSLMPR